jgi:protein gp37
MYFLDSLRGADGSKVYKTKNGFDYPLQRDRAGQYRVKSGELIRVCMTSDFFLEEADEWRGEVWQMMRARSDVKFFLLTKRPERVAQSLPYNWGDGWDNIFFNVTCENQEMADRRIPLLLDLPFKHKGIMTAPLIGAIDIDRYLASGAIEQVIAGGENYDGARPCHYDWVTSLAEQCRRYEVTFCFIETGTKFVKDDRLYTIPSKKVQSEMAFKSGISRAGRPMQFTLRNQFGRELPKDALYVPQYGKQCACCGSKLICNGCSNCGRCERKQQR